MELDALREEQESMQRRLADLSIHIETTEAQVLKLRLCIL